MQAKKELKLVLNCLPPLFWLIQMMGRQLEYQITSYPQPLLILDQ
jgi:hypothetical protein